MSINSALAKAQRDQLKALIDEQETLGAKSNLTDDEKKRLKTLIPEMDAVKLELDASLAADKKAAELKGFLTGSDNLAPISAGTAGLMDEHGVLKSLLEKMAAGRTTWDGRDGAEHFTKSAMGKLIPMESDGFGIDESQWKKVCEPTYLKSFEGMMRAGIQKVDAADLKTLSEGADPGGGFLVPPEYIARLIARKPYPTRIAEFVEVVPCSSDQVIFPRINNDADTADIYSATNPRMQWIGEKGPTASQADMGFGDVTIPVYTGQFYVEVTRNLMEDSRIPLAVIIQKFGSQAYDLGLDQVIVAGDGNAKPTGLLTNAGAAGLYCPTVNCGNPVTANGLTSLVYGLPPQYSDTEGVIALMNRTSGFATFAQIQDTSGQYIFGLAREQGPGGMAMARKPELFGYPTIFSAFMPNVGAANAPVAFGDVKEAYTLCQRVGLTVEAYGPQDRSMLQANKIGWLFRFRAGGLVTQNRAVHVGVQS